ncbi:MAG: hypothetical protein EAZ95_14760 [Bacteroidetes bacterium]|nr:MAG: hypothetical protein EAZ95_14760 [Bacteroidota bacterium]
MKSFEKWKTDEIELTFGIAEIYNLPAMQDWLQALYDITQQEEKIVGDLCQEIGEYGKFWNEEDTKAFFIIPLINLIRFQQKGKYRTFMEATFQADLIDVHHNTCALRGRVEMVVATGKQEPQTPFFFLNEYKAQRKVVTDPQGQLLIAMLAAQVKNNGLNLPIYGMYNIGQLFYFVVLVGKEYAVSKSFDATDELSLKKIMNMLKFVKQHIEQNV